MPYPKLYHISNKVYTQAKAKNAPVMKNKTKHIYEKKKEKGRTNNL